MSCVDFLARLQALLDQRRDPQQDATLLRHTEHCADCRERLSAEERLFMALSAASAEWYVGSNDRSVTGQANSPQPARFRPIRFVLMAATMSAVLLLIVLARMPNQVANDTIAVPSVAMKLRSGAPVRPLPAAFAVMRPGGVGGPSQPVDPSPQTPTPTPTPPALTPTPPALTPTPPALTPTPPALTPTPPATVDGPNTRFEAFEQFARSVDNRRISDFCVSFCKSPPLPDNSIPQVDQVADELRPLAEPFVSVLNVLRRTLTGARGTVEPRRSDETSRHVRRWQIS